MAMRGTSPGPSAETSTVWLSTMALATASDVLAVRALATL
jgi:hypothetical protein